MAPDARNIPWVQFIAWCVALGVPLTPLAGEVTGYVLIAGAGIVALWRGWVWLKQSELQSTLEQWKSSGVKFIVLTPTVMLIIMTTIWSYFGGVPALRSGDPETYVQIHQINIATGFPAFKADAETSVNLSIVNKGPHLAKDMAWKAALIAEPPLNPENEDKLYADFVKRKKLGSDSDLGIGQIVWTTLKTGVLKPRDAEDLIDGRMRLYILGYIRYRDVSGVHENEFCEWLQAPADKEAVWHLCNGHNHFVR